MTGLEGAWLVPLVKVPEAVTLVCVPYAGGRPGVFGALARGLSGVDVLAVQLPGHGQRMLEEPLSSVSEIVRGLAPAVSRAVSDGFVLLGHSMGALVALELARVLRDAGGPEPGHLIVSGCRAPSELRDTKPLHQLPEDEMIQALIELGAEPEPFAVAELRELMVPVLRADLTAVETFDASPREPLRCPITAVSGVADPDAGPELMVGWKRETSGEFRVRTVDGGHFLLEERPQDMVSVVRDVLGG